MQVVHVLKFLEFIQKFKHLLIGFETLSSLHKHCIT